MCDDCCISLLHLAREVACVACAQHLTSEIGAVEKMGSEDKGKGSGKGNDGAVLNSVAVASDNVSEAMNARVLKELFAVFTSEEPGLTTKLKHGISNLNDASLQVLSALDILGSPYQYDLPAGMGSHKSVDITTGMVHGMTLASNSASAVASLPIPVSVFSTISKDVERLIPFLEFGDKSVVTPRNLRTLCAVGALAHSLGPGNISTMMSLGYVLDLKECQALVVSSSQPGNPVVFLPPELCTPERAALRTALPTMMLSTVEKIAGADVATYSRVVALSVQEKLCKFPKMGEAFACLAEISNASGQSSLGKGKRFVLKFLVTCFSCVKRVHMQPLANVYVESGVDPMVYNTFASMKSDKHQSTAEMPPTDKKRRKAQ